MVELRKANAFDYIRFVVSALLLLFSLTVTSYAIVERKTNFWPIVPGWAALLLFIVDLFVLGVVEGLQIALVELKRQHPDSYKTSHPLAYRLGQVAAKGDNVERFLMGRQVFVVFLVFFAAKLTTIYLDNGEDFLFPAPWWFQSIFLETGILACIVVVIIAQLMPQIVAAKYPVHFLQFLVMRPAYYCCIFVEITGLTHVCWLLSAGISRLAGMTDDEFVAAKEHATNDDVLECVAVSLDDDEEEKDDEQKCGDESASGDSGNKSLSSNDNCDEGVDDIKCVATCNEVHFRSTTQLVERINRQINPDTLHVLRHYLDQHPEKFLQFPSVVGGKMYPAPQECADKMQEDGHAVPKFLTSISDPEHVPPHVVACELLAKNRELEEEVEMLRRKLNMA